MKVIRWMIFLLVISGANIVQAEQQNIISPDNEPYFNTMVGLSPFLGILGVEVQNKNHAFGIGLPGNLSYRYFFNPYQDTKFWGVFLGGYSSENADRSVDGINYSDIESRYVGAGFGYRWQWSSGWNTSVSIALEYVTSDYSNPGTLDAATESRVILFPGANLGYKF